MDLQNLLCTFGKAFAKFLRPSRILPIVQHVQPFLATASFDHRSAAFIVGDRTQFRGTVTDLFYFFIF
jgi:hypothetical protein